jgi:hypothetical protein
MRELDLILKTKVFVDKCYKITKVFLLRIKIIIDLPG